MSRTLRIAMLLDSPDPNYRKDFEDTIKQLAKDDDGNYFEGIEGLEFRPVYRQPAHRTIYLGLPEYRLIYEIHPDVVFAAAMQPWDMPFAHTPVPAVWVDDRTPRYSLSGIGEAPQTFSVNSEPVLETRRRLWESLLDHKWNLPYLAGLLPENIKDSKHIAILKPGCGRQENDDVAIALSPLSAFDDPYPDYFLIEDYVTVTPGVTGVYEEVQWVIRTTFPNNTIEKSLDDPKLAHLPEKERHQILTDLDQKEAEQSFWNRAIARSSLGKLPFTETVGSVLGSVCPDVRLPNGMVLTKTWAVLAFVLLTLDEKRTVVLRRPPEFETGPDEVLAKIALQETFGEERFTTEDAEPAPRLMPIRVDIAGEGISGPAGGPPLAEWLRAVRYGDVDDTAVTTLREYDPFIRAHGFPENLPEDVKPVVTITILPKPLYPL